MHLKCQKIAERLHRARANSESSVLEIGRLLNDIVAAATDDVEAEKQRLGITTAEGHDQSLKITQLIQAQSKLIQSFVTEMRSFIRRQIEFSDSANLALNHISKCSAGVSNLMQKSHFLALNLRIEAGRLGELGSAVSTIGKEMANFSNDVRDSNTNIVQALEDLQQSLPRIRIEMSEMDVRATKYSGELETGLHEVEETTNQLNQSLEQNLNRMEQKNRAIRQMSLATLEQLQFQDPVAQELQKAENQVLRMAAVLDGKDPNECDLTGEFYLSDSVRGADAGGDKDLSRGEVVLF